MGDERRVLAGAEPDYDGQYLVGYPSVLGRSICKNCFGSFDRAEVRGYEEYSTFGGARRYFFACQLFRIPGDLHPNLDGFTREITDSVQSYFHHDHNHHGRHANLGALCCSRCRFSHPHRIFTIWKSIKLEHHLRSSSHPWKLRQRLSRPIRLDPLRPHPPSRPLRSSRHRPPNNLPHRALRPPHHLRNRNPLRRDPLEPARPAPRHPRAAHVPCRKSGHVFSGSRVSG